MEFGDGRLVPRQSVRLRDDVAVPIEAEFREVGQLPVPGALADAVEVFDAHEKPSAGGPGEQPRQHGRPQVAEVQVAGRAGREPTRARRPM